MRAHTAILALGLSLTVIGPTAAQTYPTRPIKMVVPFTRADRSTSPPASSGNSCRVFSARAS